MKKANVNVGGMYLAKVSSKLTTVKIDSVCTHGGWNATNTTTGREVHIKTAARLRRAVFANPRSEIMQQSRDDRQAERDAAARDHRFTPRVGEMVRFNTALPVASRIVYPHFFGGSLDREKPINAGLSWAFRIARINDDRRVLIVGTASTNGQQTEHAGWFDFDDLVVCGPSENAVRTPLAGGGVRYE